MRDTEREAETQAEGEAGSMQGAQLGTRSWVSRITPRAAGSAKPPRHAGCPATTSFKAQSLALLSPVGTYFILIQQSQLCEIISCFFFLAADVTPPGFEPASLSLSLALRPQARCLASLRFISNLGTTTGPASQEHRED